MFILGVSCYYHDAAAAILHDGRIVAAAEEERFTRKKHDSAFPTEAIAFCLRQAGIAAADLDYVVFYEKPLLKFERILMTALGYFPRSWRSFNEATIGWFDEKLWIRETLRKHLGLRADQILFVDHHMAHAASAFFCSPFERAAILTVDGVGEWTTTALGVGGGAFGESNTNSLKLTSEITFPHSLGLLYSAFTAWLGFEVNEGEYKVMGMAAYGEPKYQDRVYKLLDVAADGSFSLNMEYFNYQHSPDQTFSRRFVDLFGESRDRTANFVTDLTHAGVSRQDESVRRNQYYADVAASIQRVTEDVILRMANHLHSTTGLKQLCMAGGVALNSVANGRILRETAFEDLFIQPAAGDSGGALGAALYAWHVLLGQPREFTLETAYLGEEYTDAGIQQFLDENSIRYERFEHDDRLIDCLVSDLIDGKALGWFQGRFEWGPRALGNRSIIADPRSAEMKEIVNRKIKFREPFRPFAPVVPEVDAPQFFDDLQDPARHYPTRFMLMVLPWGEKGDQVPAVNHMGTGRVQTIRREWNPRYYDLVRGFGDATGVPVLMNTSFNLRGEPIVTTPQNAWNTFRSSGIDVLVLGQYVVRK